MKWIKPWNCLEEAVRVEEAAVSNESVLLACWKNSMWEAVAEAESGRGRGVWQERWQDRPE